MLSGDTNGTAEINGTKLYYETKGAGEPVVLIHGLTLDTPIWDDQFDTLSEHLTIKMKQESDRIGIISPVYWFGLPQLVTKFVEQLRIESRAYVFSLNTFGLLNGFTSYQISKLLDKNGYKLHNWFSVLMPGSNMTLYPPCPRFIQKPIFRWEAVAVEGIAAKINRSEVRDAMKYSRVKEALLKQHYEPFINNLPKREKNFRVNADCVNCGICKAICPVENVDIAEGQVAWLGHCEGCLTCMQWCPKTSIQYKRIPWSKKRYQQPEASIHDISAHAGGRHTPGKGDVSNYKDS